MQDDCFEADERRVRHVDRPAVEELPAVIVRIVRDVEYRRSVEHDGTERERRGVSRLIEWPVGVCHGG